MMKKNVLTLLLVMTSLAGWSQQLKIEFVTPRIVHVVKGQPTKTLVVTAKKEDEKATRKGNEQGSGELTVRQGPKTGR